MISRREFVAGMAALGALPPQKRKVTSQVCLFSKALRSPDWSSVRRLGFGGVDLTVRKGGHVAPERAAEDLPAVVAAIRGEGLDVPMITTELLSASDPTARPILSSAGKLGIPFFKPGYYKYAFADVRQELDHAAQDFRGLVELGTQCGIAAGYHNHTGYLGASAWDAAKMLEGLDPRWAGFYFDPSHAVAEGGGAGWKIALNLAAPRLKMVAIKDCYWEKNPRGGWRQRFCPLGEGMVDWKYFFGALAKVGFSGPISLHIEYEPRDLLESAGKDLEFLNRGLHGC